MAPDVEPSFQRDNVTFCCLHCTRGKFAVVITASSTVFVHISSPARLHEKLHSHSVAGSSRLFSLTAVTAAPVTTASVAPWRWTSSLLAGWTEMYFSYSNLFISDGMLPQLVEYRAPSAALIVINVQLKFTLYVGNLLALNNKNYAKRRSWTLPWSLFFLKNTGHIWK